MMASSPRWRVSILVAFVCFGVYLWTACPTVYLGDSGELTVAAQALGIPHNSGYPLYALLGKVFCLIPFGGAGFRMNLFSALLAAASVGLLHDLLIRITASTAASSCAALFLGFTSLFWLQAVSAEVYALHMFFVTIALRILWWWDQRREFRRLMLLAFVLGLSLCNHLQTVMLAPAVVFFLLSREGRAFFRPRKLAMLSLLLLLPLAIYVYLPLRTEAGAVLTWGDPNTIGRFLDHVLAKAHRSGYVLNVSAAGYLARAWGSLAELGRAFGLPALFAVWGWFCALRWRRRIFCLLVVLFDLSYAVFLNTVSLEITPFNLPTLLVLAMLSGLGFADLLSRIRASGLVGEHVKWVSKAAMVLIPLIPLSANFAPCNQSRNYTAYEHAANILSTPEAGSNLFIDGDNNVFPVMYARMCEGMGESLRIIDRFNLVFRWPKDPSGRPHGTLESAVKQAMAENGRGTYLSVLDPAVFPLPSGYRVASHGVLMKAEPGDAPPLSDKVKDLWRCYSTKSFYEPMARDYMNRQVCAYFHLSLAKFFFESGSPEKGLEAVRSASRIGYNDEALHSDIGVWLTKRGLYEEAKRELDLALLYAVDTAMVLNNLGLFYDAVGDSGNALRSFQEAVDLSPRNAVYLNNLGYAFLKAGRKEEASSAFRRSLAIIRDQPGIERLLNP